MKTEMWSGVLEVVQRFWGGDDSVLEVSGVDQSSGEW